MQCLALTLLCYYNKEEGREVRIC